MTYDYWDENWYELNGYVKVKSFTGGWAWQKAEQAEDEDLWQEDEEQCENKTWWQRVKEELKSFYKEL